MPNGSVYDRYMWYLRLLTYNGFVVLADNHLNSDPTITIDVNLWLQVSKCVHGGGGGGEWYGIEPGRHSACLDPERWNRREEGISL